MSATSWANHPAMLLAIALLVALTLERLVPRAFPALLAMLSVLGAVVLIAMIVNHIWFPFNLDLMEGVLMQHARRAMHGEGIYPLPSPEFVPLAYNPLFYLLAAPFLILFGDTLTTLRMVALMGMAGSAAAIFVTVRSYARSTWWATIAVGLFCTAYAAMDAYFDCAHSDGWLICCALWGTYLIGRTSRGARIAGVIVLVAGFWFKQHGAVFLGAGLCYLTWREGARKSLVYWLIAFALGPLLYLIAPVETLGPAFHYFTWQVPSGWSELRWHSITRVAQYAKQFYLALAVIALWGTFRAIRTRSIQVLDVQLGAAFLTAFMASLDPGSTYNGFIPMGAFCIVCGSVELARIDQRAVRFLRARLAYVGALLAFATLLYDPRTLWLSASARESYADLQQTIRDLPGPVYAPGIGQFVDGPRLFPAAHWIALEDMIRGRHRTHADTARARSVLDDLRHPATTAFVLTNRPLALIAMPVNELAANYKMVSDFGNRFAALAPVPRPTSLGWPRYLYRFDDSGKFAHVP